MRITFSSVTQNRGNSRSVVYLWRVGLPWISSDFPMVSTRIESDLLGSSRIRCDWVGFGLNCDWTNLEPKTKPRFTPTPGIRNAEFIPQQRSLEAKAQIQPATFQALPFFGFPTRCGLLNLDYPGLPWILNWPATRIQSDPVGFGRIRCDWVGLRPKWAQICQHPPPSRCLQSGRGREMANPANTFTAKFQRTCAPGCPGLCQNPLWPRTSREAVDELGD